MKNIQYFFLFLISSGTIAQSTRYTDSLALVDIYQFTNGENWRNSWDIENTPIDEWYGVIIEHGRVEELNLSANSLEGNLPNSIGNLDQLAYLNLSYNEIFGEIPNATRNLTQLKYLNLSGLKLEGVFPKWINELTQMEQLFIRHTNLTGNIPDEIGQLAELTILILESNELMGGDIPQSLGNLLNLTSLQLERNNLTGKIPKEIGNLSSLDLLRLSSNNLTGEVPEELGNLSSLRGLSLGSNSLEGTLPNSIANLNNLIQLVGHSNNFTGLPDFSPMIGNSDFLRVSFSYNQLQFGDIIKNLFLKDHGEFSYSNQKIMNITNKKMSLGDTIVISASDSTEGNKYIWFKDGEQISGANSVNYQIIFDEKSEGHYFCEVSNPAVNDIFIDFDGYYLYDDHNSPPINLTLSNHWLQEDSLNQFIAKIKVSDNDIFDLHQFQLLDEGLDEAYFDISSDSIFGILPFNYDQFEYKIKVNVTDSSSSQYNQVFTLFVDGGRRMDSLALITLYQNLDGENWKYKWNIENEPISSWRGIGLSDNRVGSINLVFNDLSGNLPKEITRLNKLTDLRLSRNSITGEIPKEIGLVQNLSSIRLDINKMTGPIPVELASLERLYRLDLAGNGFTGNIPTEFENLESLGVLDLSSNKINKIPRLARLRLRRDGQLDLRYNKLDFASILKNLEIEDFDYRNQTLGEVVIDTVKFGETYTLSVSENTEGSQFKWWKQGTGYIEGATEQEYTFVFKPGSESRYHVQVSNPLLPDFYIYGEDYELYDFNFFSPSNIELLKDSISENLEAGTLVGTLSVEDFDTGDYHYFEITDQDSLNFYVRDSLLYSNESFDFEKRTRYWPNIKVTDQAGESYNREITVWITDANDPPKDIFLSNSEVIENQIPETLIGRLSTEDEDSEDSHTYQIISGTDYFLVKGDSLLTQVPLDYEEFQFHQAEISSSDLGGESISKNFIIEVIDVDDVLSYSDLELELFYPNPSENYLYLKTKKKQFDITIIDSGGKIHLKSSGNKVIDIRDLKSGVYFIHFLDKPILRNIKFIKK